MVKIISAQIYAGVDTVSLLFSKILIECVCQKREKPGKLFAKNLRSCQRSLIPNSKAMRKTHVPKAQNLPTIFTLSLIRMLVPFFSDA